MQKISRRSLIASVPALALMPALVPALVPAARAQPAAYPNKTLTMIVPYPAGGASDAAARIFAEAIGRDLKQQVIVENIGGGTGLIGATKMLAAAPDGYTFFQGSANELILAPLLNPAARYRSRDFKFAQPTTEATIVLMLRNGLDFKSFDDFVAHAQKAKASGAKPLNFATVGIDSLYHLMGDAMAKRLDADFLHVPYKGAAPAVQDLAGGQVDFAILPYQVSFDGMATQGRLKILTSFSRQLPAPLEHLARIDQSKSLPDFEYTIGGGYLLRRDVAPEVAERLRQAVGQALREPALRSRLEAEGRTVHQPFGSQQQADAHLDAEIERYTRLLKILDRAPLS